MKSYELPSNIEEHKPLKSYSGWMNEINSYDPANYHISLTRSVYIRLDGTILRISTTSTRIPKRSIWNEQNIDRKNIIFTSNRYFNLLGCRIEMLPRGLAKKRYFSRKYPIQLVIKKNYKLSSTINLEDDIIKNNNIFDKALRLTTQNIESGKLIDYNDKNIDNDIDNNINDDHLIINNSQQQNDLDFSTLILNSDLQKLNDNQKTSINDNNINRNLLPNGDETRILLFARDDREKEDWYRRFYSASIGNVNDDELRIPDIVMITDDDIAQAIKSTTTTTTNKSKNDLDVTDLPINDSNNDLSNTSSKISKNILKNVKKSNIDISSNDSLNDNINNDNNDEQSTIFDGLLLSSCSARNSPEYIKFMSRYQKACSQSNIPIIKTSLIPTDCGIKRNRRQKRQEDELWKGIDQTLYLGPCGSVVWTNVLIGRILFSCLNDTLLLGKIQEFLQKKLSAIRLPSFMEDVSIAQVHLGDTPPLIHRISQPQLDERGIWIDADVTYEGLMHMTITTKLNLLRFKRSQQHQQHQQQQHQQQQQQQQQNSPSSSSSSSNQHNNNNNNNVNVTTTITTSLLTNQNVNNVTTPTNNNNNNDLCNNLILLQNNDKNNYNLLIDDNNCGKTLNINIDTTASIQHNSAIYDSNAESSGASSSDSESQTSNYLLDSTIQSNDPQGFYHSTPGSSKRLLRIVDRITASNLFQSAAEISYIQRAMENMSTKITLRVDLKGLVSRVVINIPPPPSDRIWIAFRGPPRLWISAKPAVGDHKFDWSIITNLIENKLCEEVYKYLVYPNMIDIIVPFLGESTYKED